MDNQGQGKLDSLLKALDGSKIGIKKAYEIFNPTLQNNFLGYQKVLLQRHQLSPHLFKKRSIFENQAMRERVLQALQTKLMSFEWNKELEVIYLNF